MSTTPITLAEVNDLSRDEFVAALGPLFEGSPWIADATWPARPFARSASCTRRFVRRCMRRRSTGRWR